MMEAHRGLSKENKLSSGLQSKKIIFNNYEKKNQYVS